MPRIPKVRFGGVLLPQAYPKTQANIALSSVKPEYYSMVKAASEGLGLKDMTEDYNRPLSPWMYVVPRQTKEFLGEWAWANSGIWTARDSGCTRRLVTSESGWPKSMGR